MSRPKTVLITSGPTREPIDPVRFISNPSTGMMGFELASEARRRGYRVILVSGPTNLIPKKGVRVIFVDTASEMRSQVIRHFRSSDCLIMAAAVSDYRPKRYRLKKLKRTKDSITLELTRNPDILAGASKRRGKRIVVGFALETENLIENAKKKLETKGLDLIVANKVSKDGAPFGIKRLCAIILDKDGGMKRLRKVTKSELAKALFNKIKL